MITNLIKNLAKNVQSLLYKVGLIADYVVEYQANQGDGYTKWASGKMECWKRVNVSANITNGMSGNLYYGTISAISYPQTFLYYPTVTITAQVANGYGWMVPAYDNYAVGNTGTLYVYYSASKSNVSITANVYATGQWK